MAASESSDQVSAAVAAAQEAANASAAAAAAAFQRSTIEIWTLFAVGASVTILRTYARIRAVGIKGLTADDYLVWVGVVFYAAQSALGWSVGNSAHGMANNSMTNAERAALSPDDVEYQARVLGSKIQVAGWTVYSVLIWSLKLSMLAFYTRLTVRPPFHISFKPKVLKITLSTPVVSIGWTRPKLPHSHTHRLLARRYYIYCRHHGHLYRMQAVQPLLANQPRPREIMPGRRVTAHHLGILCRQRFDRHISHHDSASHAVAVYTEASQEDCIVHRTGSRRLCTRVRYAEEHICSGGPIQRTSARWRMGHPRSLHRRRRHEPTHDFPLSSITPTPRVRKRLWLQRQEVLQVTTGV
jgi:hypothetical protein